MIIVRSSGQRETRWTRTAVDVTVLAVVELEDEDDESVIDVREDGIGLKVGEILARSILAQVDEDRAGDVGVDGPITCQPG